MERAPTDLPTARPTFRFVKSYPSLTAVRADIISCSLCPRLREHCQQVARRKKREFYDEEYWARPVPGFGDSSARLLIVGLAPAAHGGNRTGRVFTGDSSGDWLFEALFRFGFANRPRSVAPGDGLELTDCYVTAAARCAPPGNRPTREELANCRRYLEAELSLLRRVRIVVLLGRIAWENYLKAGGWWDALSPRERPAFAHGAEALLPDGKTLLCSFHPSRQNTNTGRLSREMWYAVFARAGDLVGSRSPLTDRLPTSSQPSVSRPLV